MRQPFVPLLLSALCLLVAGCDQLGIESASSIAARKEADGKAIGGACRHAGRAIEDCYVLNRKSDRAAIYAGWREMNEYMRENKLEPVIPQLESDQQVAAKTPEPAEAAQGEDKHADKPSGKAADKSGEAPVRHRRPAP
ncbi:MAG: hypothetical protein HY855_24320 [Burkholderiales bacterium]|nr:hypothetical protein [Burkholderiales bacterium]